MHLFTAPKVRPFVLIPFPPCSDSGIASAALVVGVARIHSCRFAYSCKNHTGHICTVLSPTLSAFLLLPKLLSQAPKSGSQYLGIYCNRKTPDWQSPFSYGVGRFPHTRFFLFPNSTASGYFYAPGEANNLCRGTRSPVRYSFCGSCQSFTVYLATPNLLLTS